MWVREEGRVCGLCQVCECEVREWVCVRVSVCLCVCESVWLSV